MRTGRVIQANLVGGPGVKPGFLPHRAKSGRAGGPGLQLRTLPLCSLTLPTHWNSRRESNPDLFFRNPRLGPKRHHASDHASLTVEGMRRIEF